MKIRFIQIAATDRQCFVTGQEHDLPDEEAVTHIRAGHAVEVNEKPADAKAAQRKSPKQ